MEESGQWQAFVETGDIRHYLRYKEEQAQALASMQQHKEFADGCICDTSNCVTRSEI